LPDGILGRPTYHESGWIEEPTVYRGGTILLGVVSHEGEAFMNVTRREHTELV
jgi:hypothetical protein